MQDLSLMQNLVVWALPVLFAITLHEVAHGWTALQLGDNTAKSLGRLSLNPIKHIDPIGTLVLPATLLVFSSYLLANPFLFGWAKPVPVDWRNLRKPKQDMILIAAAGPIANFFMAVLWVFVIKAGLLLQPDGNNIGTWLVYMGLAGIMINLILMVLNLLPIPPLDGSRILTGFLPIKLARPYVQLERYGFFILIALLALGWLSYIIGPPIFYLQDIFLNMAGISL